MTTAFMTSVSCGTVRSSVCPDRVDAIISARPGIFARVNRSSAQPIEVRTAFRITSSKSAGIPRKQQALVCRSTDSTVSSVSSQAKQAVDRAGTKADEATDPSERAKFVAEFCASGLFNFLTCTAFAASTQAAGGNAVRALAYTMGAYGLIFPLVISIFAPISKAHFNPMVTFSMVVSGQQSVRSGIGYVIAQSLGAILGAAFAFWGQPGAHQTATSLGAAAVPAGRSVAQAFLGEAAAAAVFIFVLFAAIVDPRGWGKLGPLSLGLTVPLLMWSVGPISSLCINPARAFGPAVVTGMWTHHWIWWTAPLIGGAIAAKIYTSLFLPSAGSA